MLSSSADHGAYLLDQAWVTTWETLQGFLLAILLGIPVAVLLAGSRIAEKMIYPMLLAINSLPKVAVAPILVVWMGFGQLPKVVMVLLLCFFPIVLAATALPIRRPDECREDPAEPRRASGDPRRLRRPRPRRRGRRPARPPDEFRHSNPRQRPGPHRRPRTAYLSPVGTHPHVRVY